MISSRPSILLGVIFTILLLLHPTSTAAQELVTGNALLTEIEQLHASLSRVTDLLAKADIPDNEAVMYKTANLVRRVRSLVFATRKYDLSQREQRIADRKENNRRLRRQEREMRRFRERGSERMLLRGSGIGSGELEVVEQEQEQNTDQVQEHGVERHLAQAEMDDHVARDLYATTISFPECKERFLEDCLDIIREQVIDLGIDAEFTIHEKRGMHQENYNKVVLVTDMTATYVKGRNNDGIVSYPFPWDDAVTQVPRLLGVDGRWDCHAQTPEDCCALIQSSEPNPDTKGNFIQCHIFVPYGGVGRKKRTDRILVNLSPDGRVHEAPIVS
mmetsp:Transcript_31900/g.67069  ORF Transcript_31900/g.67069 Transcript_31900/m.67069 type:complete len:331 (+) Transcript_31900:123-1115(+)|eukprot:CAMPEP_0172304194 /NCGR_PEP_ID=MMETSP1058-20130122/5630_1 /TAXON_ID=83371 /ORGANISM="Detonula confervacea, Strain CCMP 353" /LENGTH=330 /DNA_ID=CAMNT_0013015319 /DNA_START=83 /DNA_END=1075 /DNA_ORIENTATION=-